MPEPQETVAYQWQRLVNNVRNLPKRISQTIQGTPETEIWSSLENQTLDFDLLEDHLKEIHRIVKKDGSDILGTRLILDERQNLIEIKIYSRKGEKNALFTNHVKINSMKNIPPDIMEEIQSKGRVELTIHLMI